MMMVSKLGGGALVLSTLALVTPARAEACPDQPECGYGFIRGDANNDKELGIADAMAILNWLYQGADAPCIEASDVNADGDVGLDDAVSLLNHLFQGGPPPGGHYPDTEASCALYEDFPGLPELGPAPDGGGASVGFEPVHSGLPLLDIDDWFHTEFVHPYSESEWDSMWGWVYEYIPSGVWDCFWDDPYETALDWSVEDEDMSYRHVNVNLVSDDGGGGCECAFEILADAGAERGWIIPVELGFKACSDDEWTTEFGVTGDAFWGSWIEPPGQDGRRSAWQWESAEYEGALDFCPDCLQVRLRTVSREQSWTTLYEGEYWCRPGCDPDAQYWILNENSDAGSTIQ